MYAHVFTVERNIVSLIFASAIVVLFCPIGTDGGLDFQCIFAGSDQKLSMQLKNKGKYDTGFTFSFTKASNGKSYSDMFKLAPMQAALYPGEKSMSVSVTFHSKKEVTIKDESILKCEVREK